MKTLWRGLRSGRPERAIGMVDWAGRIQTIATVIVAVLGFLGLTRFAEGPLGIVAGVAFLFAVGLVVALNAVARLRTQLDRYETSAFDLAFDPSDTSCHHEHFIGPTGQNYLAVEIYRVRLANRSAWTIEAVTVSLERFAPQGAAFLPVPLRLMGDDPHSGFRGSRLGIALHPGSSRYFEVIALSYRPNGEVADLTLTYASQDPNVIDSGRRYELSVVAEGRDVRPERATYVAWIRSRRLYFCALEDEVTHPQRVTLPG